MTAVFLLVLLSFVSCTRNDAKIDRDLNEAYYGLGRIYGILAYQQLIAIQLESGRKFTMEDVIIRSDSIRLARTDKRP